MQTVITEVCNGVNVKDLTQTIGSIKREPEIARFRFHASNLWISGGHNRSAVSHFYGGMENQQHAREFVMEAGEPPSLLGNDEGANPVEFLLHALAACVTTSMVYHAAAEGIQIKAIESRIEGGLDLRGFLRLDPAIRNGFERIKMTMRIRTNATQGQWKRLIRFGLDRSPVYDSVANGVPVDFCAERL